MRHLSSFLNSPAHLLTKDPAAGFNHKTVVILGFAGSKHKHLDKYSAIYNDLGFRTSQLEVQFNFHKSQAQIKQTISQIVHHLPKDPSRPTSVLFHVMSNGGFEFYTPLYRELLGDPSYRILGTVFDSAPCLDLTPKIVARAMTASWSPILAFLGTLLVRILFFAFAFHSVRTSYGEHKFRFQELFREHHKSNPMLFLYSKEDLITPYKPLEEYIENLRRSERVVSSHLFQNTGHVQHLLQKPQEYRNTILQFLQQNNIEI